MWKYLIFLLTLISNAVSVCTSLAGICYDVKQKTLQFNINWFGVPTYEDAVSSVFNENQCGRKRYSFLYHNELKCKKTKTENTFDCESKVKSVFLKVFDTTDYLMQQYILFCSSNLVKKYIDISTLSCKINGIDPFLLERLSIGVEDHLEIKVDKNNFPIYEEYYPGEDTCVWNYEVNGIWSTLVITILILVLVFSILFITIFVYAQQHRNQNRNALNRTMKVGLVEEFI